MQTLTEIRAILAVRGLRPKHRLGQNFLHDHNHLRRLVEVAGVRAGEVVLEVGPGTGTLTEALLERDAEIVVCELDDDMADIIADRLGEQVTLVRGDCLDGKHAIAPALVAALGGRPFVLVANLPYGAATPLMATLLSDHPECRGQFVTIQREVADRLTAKPGTKAYGPITILAQTLAEVRMIATLPPGCFWPPPTVTSAMISIVPKAERPDIDPKALGAFTARLFGMRRKQLGTILGRDRTWPEGLVPTMRPEELSPGDVLRLLGTQID